MSRAPRVDIHGAKPDKTDKPIEEYDVRDIKHRKQKAFLEALMECAGVYATAKAVGINPSTHYHWLYRDPIYAEAYRKQWDRSIIKLEEEARRRAVDGIDEPVYHNGEVVGHKRRYSDNLLMFLMKQRDPTYKDNYTNTNVGIWGGEGGVRIEFNIPRPPKELPEPAIEAEYTIQDSRLDKNQGVQNHKEQSD